MMYPSIAGQLQQHRRATARRLHRVNRALSAWDEYDGAANMPADWRPRVQPPLLERATLKELQGMLIDRLGELELAERELWAAWRN
jgi:hypothetical protein